MRVEVIGEATLILGNCLDVLPTLNKVDAVITDPPYGIGKDGQIETTGGHGGRKGYEFKGWDQERPLPSVFALMLQKSDVQVIWGGNYFADLLPPTMGWLVWDKGQHINQSDGELAWTSLQQALRIITINRVDLLIEGTYHPTQKPFRLMQRCIEYAGMPYEVLDPFMGSGSTGVACVNLGRRFIGIEIDRHYFDIACERIENAQRQQRMFA